MSFFESDHRVDGLAVRFDVAFELAEAVEEFAGSFVVVLIVESMQIFDVDVPGV